MARQLPLLDTVALRTLFEPAGEWARECGERVKRQRAERGYTISRLAELADTNVQTIYKIERGLIIPREYLKASIAYALNTEIIDLWGPLSRRTIGTRAKAVA